MYISLNWIKDFTDLPKNLSPDELGQLVTLKSAEIEYVEEQAAQYDKMVTGLVTKLEKHPDADKLKVAQVDIGEKTVQIVCGGENLQEGMYVAVTKVGAQVRWHGEGDLITLEKAKIRGVASEGMIAASNEIGLEAPNEGPRDIRDLAPDKPKPGTALAEYLNATDIILEVDNKTLTHRPDLWGHHGFAREVAAITDSKFTPLAPDVKIPTKGESPEVEIQDFDLCPRYCGLIIDNVTVKESPEWLKARLRAIGNGNHNNIVDVTNYVMAELGQPMHAFDKNFIEGGIIVRRAKKDEKITTLDDKERKLADNMLVIADHKKPVAVAGVMGGQNSEIKESTTSIVLEAASFNAANVRRTSTKLGLRTDAVQRFEKSLDPNLPELAIKRAAELILQLCPEATIGGPITDIQKFDKKPLKIDLDLDKTRSKIGIDIPNKDIKKILTSLEFTVAEKGKNAFTVTVPTFRATKDVTIEDDLIEEVARMYGYDNIPAQLPSLPTRLPEENTERFQKHRARELFSYGLGYTEVYNYSFYGQKEIDANLLTEDGHLMLDNYLSEDQSHLRTTLTPNILRNIELNIKYRDQFKIYEIGHTYKEVGQYFPLEEKIITGALVQKGSDSDELFYQAKAAIEAFLQKFHIPASATKGIKNAPYAHPNKATSYIDQNGQTIAKAFILHPQVAKNTDIDKYSVALFEINFTEALKIASPEHRYQPINRFPSTDFDISVLIDRETEIATIQEAIHKGAPELLQSADLFDIYQGEHVADDQKAVAFKIRLQAPDRTLTDQEMTEAQSAIFKNLEALGGTIRGR